MEEDLHSKRGVPPEAKKTVEYRINLEDKHGDVVDTDHRETLEEARNHFFTEEENWSIEEVVSWGIDGRGVVKQRSRIVDCCREGSLACPEKSD